MLLKYYHLVRDAMNTNFDEIIIQHIPRGYNARVDAYPNWQT